VNGKDIQTILNTLPISIWPFPRILLGVLLERAISHADECFWPLAEIFAQGPAFIKHSYGRTDLVRNDLAKELLKSDFTHVIMLDIDHTHPANIIQMLSGSRRVELQAQRTIRALRLPDG
jgi:hypothetical protein